ncbi:MAG TPA: hypothetical protein VFT42_02490 [Solirubrobacteraceae bacterium]|nr:hypothetical protein [Solirubrobacteraceae bacterium]
MGSPLRFLSKIFSSRRGDDEAAEREEYGLGDPGEQELRGMQFGPGLAGAETVEAAERELDEFKAPKDPYD